MLEAEQGLKPEIERRADKSQTAVCSREKMEQGQPHQMYVGFGECE